MKLRLPHLRTALASLLLLAFGGSLQAAAWTQAKGRGQVILTSSLFHTTQQFNRAGDIEKFEFGGRFRKFEVNAYVEYGLSDSTTLVVNLLAPFLEFSNDFGSQNSAGTGDLEFGLRRRLNSPESRTVISAQLIALAPTYSESRTPPPGNHQADVESRFMVGRGGSFSGRPGFWSADIAYRYRNGAPADQFRSEASVGLDLTPRVTLMGQFFGITGLRNGQPFVQGTNPNVQSDFDLYKGQISVVTRVGGHSRIQVGWNAALAGRNTGQGQTVLVSLWRDF